MLILMSGVFLLVGSLIGSGAYFTHLTQERINKFSGTLGKVYLKIIERDMNNNEITELDNVNFGIDGKKVSLKNPEENDALEVVVRVMFVPMFKDKNLGFGTEGLLGEFSSPVSVSGQSPTMTLGDFTLYFNPDWEKDWFFNEKDGYFYYRKILPKGGETEVLLMGMSQNNFGGDEVKVKLEVLGDAMEADKTLIERGWSVVLSEDGTVNQSES